MDQLPIWVSKSNIISKTERLVSKTVNFVSKTANCVSKTMNTMSKSQKLKAYLMTHKFSKKFPFFKGAGLILWRFEGFKIKILMMRVNGKLDCFGGKIEYDLDQDSAQTAAREFVEEAGPRPYMYLTGDYPKYPLVSAQAYFESLIRKNPLLAKSKDVAWGIYFCQVPHIPVTYFQDREDELISNFGNSYQAEWIDLDLLQTRNKHLFAPRVYTVSYKNVISKIVLMKLHMSMRVLSHPLNQRNQDCFHPGEVDFKADIKTIIEYPIPRLVDLHKS